MHLLQPRHEYTMHNTPNCTTGDIFMSKLLRIDASSRIHDSQSRELADFFVNHWLSNNTDGELIVRDLVANSPPHITDATIAGFYTSKESHSFEYKQATALSDKLIKELMDADALLIDTPMYNFSIPSALKAWIDQIVRIGETFNFSPDSGYEGLVTGKQAYVITASGASFADENMKAMDFMTPYLNTLLGFLGFAEIKYFTVEGTTTDETLFAHSKKLAQQQITSLGETS